MCPKAQGRGMQTREDCFHQEEDPGFLAEVALVPAPKGHWVLSQYGFAGRFQCLVSYVPVSRPS